MEPEYWRRFEDYKDENGNVKLQATPSTAVTATMVVEPSNPGWAGLGKGRLREIRRFQLCFIFLMFFIGFGVYER